MLNVYILLWSLVDYTITTFVIKHLISKIYVPTNAMHHQLSIRNTMQTYTSYSWWKINIHFCIITADWDIWNIKPLKSISALGRVKNKDDRWPTVKVFQNSRESDSMSTRQSKVPILGTSLRVFGFYELQSTEIKWTFPPVPVSVCHFLFWQNMNTDATSFKTKQ